MQKHTNLIFKSALLLILIQFTILTTFYAQAPPMKWGQVDEEDLNMTTYAADPDADMLVLCDYGTTTLEIKDDIEVVYTRHIRIKILTEEGAEEADAKIYHHRKERIYKVQAHTINGQEVSKVRKEDIFEEKLEGSRYVRKFAFPNVKAGSVIEYKYSFTSPFIHTPRAWYFQRDIPLRWSECRFTVPEYMEYIQVSKVNKPYDIKEREDGTTTAYGRTANTTMHRFVMKDMPAMEEESFITTMNDYRSKMQFQLVKIVPPSPPYALGTKYEFMTNWKELVESWMKEDEGGRQFKYKANHKKILNDARTFTASITDTEKQMTELFKFIQNSYSWDGDFSIWISEKNLNTVYQTKSGNSADINMSLIACLRDAGIDAEPVLLSTRSHGQLMKVYPIIRQFDHLIVLAKVNGKEYLLDAIDSELAPNMIHPESLNGEGFLAKESTEEPVWIPLIPKRGSELVNINLKLSAEESTIEFTGVSHGYYARLNRIYYNDDEEEDYVDDRLGTLYDFEVEDTEFQNTDKPGERFIEKMTLTSAEAIDITADNIYINPMLMEQTEERLFSLEERTYPVDFTYPRTEKYMLNLEIPEGYEVVSQPENMKLQLPDDYGSYLYLLEVRDNRIQLRCEESLNKQLYYPEEYPGLKEFFDRIFDKEAEQIVLRKL